MEGVVTFLLNNYAVVAFWALWFERSVTAECSYSREDSEQFKTKCARCPTVLAPHEFPHACPAGSGLESPTQSLSKTQQSEPNL